MNKTWRDDLERGRWWFRWRGKEPVSADLPPVSSSRLSGARIIEFALAE